MLSDYKVIKCLKLNRFDEATQSFKEAIKAYNDKIYPNVGINLRKALEDIVKEIYKRYGLKYIKKKLHVNLINLFDEHKHRVFEFSTIPAEDQEELNELVNWLGISFKILKNLTNACSHNREDDELGVIDEDILEFIIGIFSSFISYLFCLFRHLPIKLPIIKNLSDIQSLWSDIKRLQKYENTPDIFDILIVLKEDFKEELREVYNLEEEIIQVQTRHDYHLVQGIFNQALEILERIYLSKKNMPKIIYYSTKARLFIRNGFAYRMFGQKDSSYYNHSKKCYKKAIKISNNIEESDIKNCFVMISHVLIAEVLRVSNSLSESEQSLNKANILFESVKRGKIVNLIDFCLGYFYNQSGLINLQKTVINNNKNNYIEKAIENHCNGRFHFSKLGHYLLILNSTMDLVNSLYVRCLLKNCDTSQEISKMLNFLFKLPKRVEFLAYQYEHNISLTTAKFLILTLGDEALKKAEDIIISIEDSKLKNQDRAYGAELILLGEVQLLRYPEKLEIGVRKIEEGLNKLKDHEQVSSICKFELSQILKMMEGLDNYNQEEICKLKEKFLA